MIPKPTPSQDNATQRQTPNPKPTLVPYGQPYGLLISKSIWTTWCERTIRGTQHADRIIEATWWSVINRRLSEDTIRATRVQGEKTTLNGPKHMEKALLEYHGSTPENWLLRGKGFLVGMNFKVRPITPLQIESHTAPHHRACAKHFSTLTPRAFGPASAVM